MKSVRTPSVLANLKCQRGLAIVEFTIGFPVFLLLLLAVFELGRMLSIYSVMQQSSRDAARYLSHHALNNTTGTISLNSALQGVAQNLAVYGTPNVSNPLLTGVSAAVDSVGVDHVRVRVFYSFSPILVNSLPGLFGDRIPLKFTLTATTVMRAM